MKTPSFIIGTLFGASIAAPLLAATYLVPAWTKQSVRPFILVKEDSIISGKFIPINSTSVTPPEWRKSELTAIIAVKEDAIISGKFIPANTTSVIPPEWKKEEITPIIQVVENPTTNNFIPAQ